MKIYDTIIIGSGPAAYSCALYLQSYQTILLEGTQIGNNGPGGQLTTTTLVDNYPAITTISGNNLVENMQTHSNPNTIGETATKLAKDENLFTVSTKRNTYVSKSVVIATGASARRLFVEGTRDHELWNKGVSACAVCDGFLFKDKDVCVVGGGDSAMEEALYLSKICRKVFVLHRRNEFRARCDMLEKMKGCRNVEILTPFELVKVEGSESVESMDIKEVVKDGVKWEEKEIEVERVGIKQKEEIGKQKNENIEKEKKVETIKKIKIDGLFFGIGHDPNTRFIENIEKVGDYVKTNSRMETSLSGVFACGDVQDSRFRQANTAAASGCVAALSVIEYLKSN